MRVTFLGTNGWYDTPTGSTPCIFIETAARYIILDAGYGFYKAKKLINSEKPVSLFISHLHYDHLIGLHTLPIFKLVQGIDIYANKIIMKGLKSFLRRPYTSLVRSLPTKVRFHTVGGNSVSPIKFQTERLRHSVPCHGYKFNIEGKTVTYCTDTGLCDNLKKLAKNADLLITECAMAPKDKSQNLFHITPETAAYVAAKSGAKKLALCHFDPAKYATLDSRKFAQNAARAVFKNTVAACDGVVIKV